MAHKEQVIFCKGFDLRSAKSVLDVGSYDVNGNNRHLFSPDAEYVGIDIYPGKNVDEVINIHDYNPGRLFDCVVSTEMLEHSERPVEAVKKMYELTKKGGALLITAAGPARREHGTHKYTPGDSPATLDYYRNITPGDFAEAFPGSLSKYFKEHTLVLERGDKDIYFYGVKK